MFFWLLTFGSLCVAQIRKISLFREKLTPSPLYRTLYIELVESTATEKFLQQCKEYKGNLISREFEHLYSVGFCTPKRPVNGVNLSRNDIITLPNIAGPWRTSLDCKSFQEVCRNKCPGGHADVVCMSLKSNNVLDGNVASCACGLYSSPDFSSTEGISLIKPDELSRTTSPLIPETYQSKPLPSMPAF